MTILVNPLHHYFRPAHLEHVIAEMRRRGPPTIKACWDAEASMWHAREGTHRLRACVALGLSPVLVPVPWPRRKRRKGSLERARFAALWMGTAHVFERVVVRTERKERDERQ